MFLNAKVAIKGVVFKSRCFLCLLDVFIARLLDKDLSISRPYMYTLYRSYYVNRNFILVACDVSEQYGLGKMAIC